MLFTSIAAVILPVLRFVMCNSRTSLDCDGAEVINYSLELFSFFMHWISLPQLVKLAEAKIMRLNPIGIVPN